MMKNNIQNIFMDLKSYELIKNRISLDELISSILSTVNTTDLKPISISGHLFEVEFHPENDYLGFTYTMNTFHDVCHKECRFRNSVYIYSSNALSQYDEGFSGITILLFTTKKYLYIVPAGENGLSIMDCESGKLTRKL